MPDDATTLLAASGLELLRKLEPLEKSAMFLGSGDLAELLDGLKPLSCLDIGARGGIAGELDPLGQAAEVYGFEPDEGECAALNQKSDDGSHPFGALRFLPIALGARREQRTLNIMRHAGASSLLPPDPQFKEKFRNRSAYFEVERTQTVDTRPLDDVIDEYKIANTVYMKIDVEGFELEILRGAEALLASSLLAVRAEVSLAPARIGQPDFGEIASYLRQFDFMPMGFLYLVDWRSLTRIKYPRKARGPIPYSRGQTIHGDALFLRDPASLDHETEEGSEALIRLAFLALLYEYVDFAHDILDRPAIGALLKRRGYEGDIAVALGVASRYLARLDTRRRLDRWRKGLVKRVASDIRHAFVG